VRIIRITIGALAAEAELNDTRTAEAIWSALPLTAPISVWGDEIYFAIPVALGTERGQETVAPGDLGYWEPGRALCLFFGPTPVSRGEEIRPYSPVTVVGRLRGEVAMWRRARAGEHARVERAAEEAGAV
jgi:uncharacterized protein